MLYFCAIPAACPKIWNVNPDGAARLQRLVICMHEDGVDPLLTAGVYDNQADSWGSRRINDMRGSTSAYFSGSSVYSIEFGVFSWLLLGLDGGFWYRLDLF